jgi:hypothetical protein
MLRFVQQDGIGKRILSWFVLNEAMNPAPAGGPLPGKRF